MPPPSDSPLTFSRAERTFAIALVIIGLIGWTTPYWVPAVLGPGEPLAALSPIERAEFEAEVAEWTARVDAVRDSTAAARAARDSAYAARRAYYAERDRRRAERASTGFGASRTPRARRVAGPPPEPKSVDPNRADSATLRRTGLPPYVVSRLLKYRAKAGGFASSDDLDRLYGLDAATFATVRRYLLDGPLARLPRDGEQAAEPDFLATLEEVPRVPARASEPLPASVVDVNDASEEDLVAIRGIGPFYARQILDYRDRLGGFTSVAQVAETPKLRAGAFEGWREQLKVAEGARPFATLAINRLDARALARHPYLPYTKAATLVAYREHHGAFGGVDDLYGVVALDSGMVARLAPYLEFEE